MSCVELLAPAGSYESLTAGINAGADAVYIGGVKFGARAYADNPDTELLIKGIDYAHRFGKKVYMTVNTLLKNQEISELAAYIKPYYEAGLDAAIVQDFGVFSVIKEKFPELEIHASTQMGILGAGGAGKLFEMGASRVVPARELSLDEIKRIKASCGIEIECFVHGSLCYAYSGQCLMSSLIGGRSANRGRCAQTCRLVFDFYNKASDKKSLNSSDKRNLLSCKDLCSLDLLPDIVEAGVDSLKIEGRMKSPTYTAGVVSVYRKYLDLYYKSGRNGYKVEACDRKLLLDLFDRGGQTEGYYNKHNGRDMIAMLKKPEFREANTELSKHIQKKYIDTAKKLAVTGRIVIEENLPLQLDLEAEVLNKKINLRHKGSPAQKALKLPVKKEDIEKQLLKTGNTPYEFEKLEIILKDKVFIPNKYLNELRREAFEKLDNEILGLFRRRPAKNANKAFKPGNENRDLNYGAEPSEKIEAYSKAINLSFTPGLHIVCEEKSQLEAVLDFCENYKKSFKTASLHNPAENTVHEKAEARISNYINEISFEADTLPPKLWKSIVKRLHKLEIKANLYLPHIFRTEAENYFNLNKEFITGTEFDGFIIRCLEEVSYLDELLKGGKKPFYIFDYNMYGFNKEAERCIKGMGASRLTLPVELNLKELSELNCTDKELIAYGRLPMMISAQCLRKNTLGCDRKYSLLTLRDRYNQNMPVKNRCEFCYNTIYNSLPLSVIGIADNIRKLNPAVIRLWFTTENQKDCICIVNKYIKCFIEGEQVEEPSKDFTRGHLKRGVE